MSGILGGAGIHKSGITGKAPIGTVVKTTILNNTDSVDSSSSGFSTFATMAYTGVAGNILHCTCLMSCSVRSDTHAWFNVYYAAASNVGNVGSVHWYDDSTNGHLLDGSRMISITGQVVCLSGSQNFSVRAGTTSSPAVALGGVQRFCVIEIQQ